MLPTARRFAGARRRRARRLSGRRHGGAPSAVARRAPPSRPGTRTAPHPPRARLVDQTFSEFSLSLSLSLSLVGLLLPGGERASKQTRSKGAFSSRISSLTRGRAAEHTRGLVLIADLPHRLAAAHCEQTEAGDALITVLLLIIIVQGAAGEHLRRWVYFLSKRARTHAGSRFP